MLCLKKYALTSKNILQEQNLIYAMHLFHSKILIFVLKLKVLKIELQYNKM